MKTIIAGKEERAQRVTCEHCKAVFDFEEKDMKLIKSCKDYKLYEVDCPCCGRQHWVRDIDFFGK